MACLDNSKKVLSFHQLKISVSETHKWRFEQNSGKIALEQHIDIVRDRKSNNPRVSHVDKIHRVINFNKVLPWIDEEVPGGERERKSAEIIESYWTFESEQWKTSHDESLEFMGAI